MTPMMIPAVCELESEFSEETTIDQKTTGECHKSKPEQTVSMEDVQRLSGMTLISQKVQGKHSLNPGRF
jgi:hypothetical protein